jgi:hypothetical protein
MTTCQQRPQILGPETRVIVVHGLMDTNAKSHNSQFKTDFIKKIVLKTILQLYQL